MWINRLFGALTVLGCFFLGSYPYAQKSSQKSLATVKSVKCVFPLRATGTWSKEEPRAEVKAAALSVRFDSIDTDDGTAQAKDVFGTFYIIVRLSGETLHFVQVFRDGPLYVTTIFNKESPGGKLKAVHTRHELTDIALPGFTSSPEQYYGECAVE